MSDGARPENAGSQREVDALSGLPEDSRVHLEDIEWPELDWSDSDDVPPPPAPPVLRLVVSEPRPTPDRLIGDGGQPPALDEPPDWRSTVPFWLRMPEPAIDEVPAEEATSAQVPADDAADRALEAEDPPATEAPATGLLEANVPSAEPARPSTEADDAADAGTDAGSDSADNLDDLPPEEELTPLPGTTGEAVFFPPSPSRGFAPESASAASPDSAPSADQPALTRTATASTRAGAGPGTVGRPAAGRSGEAPFSGPSAPYAQYDTPETDWERRRQDNAWADRGDESIPAEPRTPPIRAARPSQPALARRRWLIRGAVIGAAISALVISLVAVLAIQGRFNSVDGTITGAPVGNPEQTVAGYLNALAHSDSQQALGFAKLRPADQRMLTDEALAASNKVAPLRQIAVHTTELTDYRAQVEATYQVGGRKVTQSFTVYAVGTEWKLYDVARKVDLTQLKTADLPLTLNGINAPTESIELFPGRYQVATTDARYRLTGESFVVVSPNEAPELGQIRLELTSTGIADIAAAANGRLTRCLAARELHPAGCGFGAVPPKGRTVRLDTIRWKVSKGLASLKRMRPSLDPANPRLATADILITVRVTAKDTKGGSLGVGDTVTTVLAELTASGIVVTLN